MPQQDYFKRDETANSLLTLDMPLTSNSHNDHKLTQVVFLLVPINSKDLHGTLALMTLNLFILTLWTNFRKVAMNNVLSPVTVEKECKSTTLKPKISSKEHTNTHQLSKILFPLYTFLSCFQMLCTCCYSNHSRDPQWKYKS